MNTGKLKHLIYYLSIPVISVNICLQVAAQIVPDNTLGAESSIVNQLETLKQQIEGGAIRGENLFHSFTEFNVGNGESVHFVNPQSVSNILTRVTGNNLSQIMGILGVNGNANLFLLNPNGFIFGKNASLDLNGSFIATTGDIQLGEEGFFSATDTQGSSLLSVKPEVIFSNVQNQIENRATLAVKEGNNIILIAEEINNIGNLTAPKGEIILQGNKVNISENSQVNVSGNDGGGEIKIQGQEEINIGENVSLKADALLMGDGGKIELISSGKIEFLGNISARGENAGEVIIEGAEVINNGEIDLGAENSENQENTIASEDQTNGNAIASEDETNGNAIASEDETNENAISSEDETNGNAIASEDQTNGNAIASEDETNGNAIASEDKTNGNAIAPEDETNENTIASEDETNGNAIALEDQTIENNLGANEISSPNTQITAANPRRLEADTTLGNENSQIETIEENNERVIGGAERGANLFHSFLEFNIETGKGVYFANPEGINNILARVTGNNISEIRGTLGVEGSADLYFINPNGLFFNQNASLDLNGSFFASTAEAIIFNEFEYSAVNPNIPPIIDVGDNGISPPNGNSPNPTGLRFAYNPGDIILRNEETPTGNLAVNPGQTLGLIGGNVTVDGVEINSPSSNIIIGGLNQAGIVNINPDLSLSFPQGINRGDVSLINSTVLDVAGNDGGSININAQNIDINNSEVLAGMGGRLVGFEDAQAGDIKLDVSETLKVENSFILNNVNFNAIGNSGKVIINAKDIVIKDASVRTSASGRGIKKSGGIEIETGTLELTDGGKISVDTFREGDTGNIVINASESITIDGENSGENIIDSSSVIRSTVFASAKGNSEGIEINTNTLNLIHGGQIDARSFGDGNVGNIVINASEINIDGEGSNRLRSNISTTEKLNSATENSGDIEIKTNTLNLTNGGEINANTFKGGDGGKIVINASENIVIDGESIAGFSSGIYSEVSSLGKENSQGIEIDTHTLKLTNGGKISTSTFGEGDAGKIVINASDITVDGETSDGFYSGIFSTIETKPNGNPAKGDSKGIEINTNTLNVTNGGEISASTSGEGDAGKIVINASDIALDGKTSDGSPSGIYSLVLIAKGNSEGIEINTNTLELTNSGTISASTFGEGDAGKIVINASESITVNGENSDFFSRGINSVILPSAKGDSKGIEINTNILKLTNGGQINASTLGDGDAGKIVVEASDIIIDGKNSDSLPSGFVSAVSDFGISNISIDGENSGGLLSIIVRLFSNILPPNLNIKDFIISNIINTSPEGNSLGIDIQTNTLYLTDGGTIDTSSTLGKGSAGPIKINASEQIFLSDTFFSNILDRQIGGIFSFTLTIGKAGDIKIYTPQLTISEGASIESFTQGQGEAGKININATESLILNTDTKLIVESSDAGTAGDINIKTPLLTIGENAQLSATATETSTAEKAGDINLKVNQLNISGELGIFAETQSTPEAGSLTIQPYQTNPNLNIEFTENGFISARTTDIGKGGSITITAPENIDIRGLGSITAETSGSGKAGNIDIDTQNLTIADGVTITTSTESSGNAGLITINTDESIFLTNEVKITSEVREGATGTSEGIVINTPILSISDRSQISAATEGEGEAGDITIDARDSVTIDDNSLLNVQTDSIGEAGNIDISTNTLTIGEDSELSAKTTVNAIGEAGTITIKANFLDITGKLGIFAETDGIADAGSLNINPNDNSNLAITFFDEGQISASTTNAGKGGNININAPQTINLQGNGTIKVETEGSGEAGDINFTSQQLNISEGVTISALTSGEGEAGSINLNIGDEIIIDSGTTFTVETKGEKDAGDIELTANKITIGEDAELSARSTENARGKAGNIELNTNQLIVFGDKGIFASTEGEGEGGKITIQPLENNLFLEINFFNDGKISASTSGSGKGGDIEITGSDVINISGDGNIQVETDSSGEAGSIIINADNQINLSNEINISASTFSSGKAGNINLSAPNSINILGDGIIKVETAGSGDAGSILIESNEINLSEGITLSASTSNIGNSQDVILTGNLINLDNATIQALTTGEGNPGSILISNRENNNANQVNLTNSTISTTINAEGNRENAPPANIIINSDNLSLDSSTITASTSANRDAGNINFNANNINLNNSQIEALTTNSGKGGNINIPNSENLNLVNNTEISASTSGEGFAGSIDLNVNQAVSIDSGSQLKVETESIGDAGDIEIDTPILTIGENAELTARSKNTATGIAGKITLNTNQLNISGELGIFAETEGVADAGNLTINPLDNNPNLTISFSRQGNISASTKSSGNGGDININADENISISGDGIISVLTSGSGIAGTITIESQNITLTEGIEINASTFSSGDSGDINLFADNINLDNATIQAITSSSGKGGNINIPDAENLNLVNNSEISASTSGEGFAGSIDLNVNQAVSIDSGSQLKVETESIGDAGDIEIDTPILTIGENAQLSARSKNTATGIAGNITLNTNQLNISGELGIFAETEGEADAGKLTINPLEDNPNLNINFSNEGNISASTSGSGDGGDIKITAPETIIISGDGIIKVETDSSGDAGSILIESHEINLTDGIEISASTSNLGNSKEITLEGNLINLNDATIKALTTGEGNPGNILISNGENNNANQVNLTNSTISTTINAEGNRENAPPANIIINSDNLSLDSSTITASTSANRDAGEINFNANNINLNNSQIEALTTNSGKGGNINIPDAENLNLVNNSEISASTTGEGKAGSIDLNVNQAVSIDSGSQLKVETESIGDAGDIEIDTPILTIGENAQLSARSKNTATGIAGNITLNTNQLNISGELGIFAETEGEADAGSLKINPNDNPNLDIIFFDEGQISASTSGAGKGGNIEITSPSIINISGDGIIKVETNGSGDAGSILIEGNEINLTDGIEISASTSNLGNSKEITLEGNLINLDDATIKALTTGEGNPGNILISNGKNNANQVKLTNSTISTEIKADGDRENAPPANITINSDNLSLDSSMITASTSANRDAGEIKINTPTLTIWENSEISASTSGSGDGGDMEITADNLINITGNGSVKVETNGSGDAGSILIEGNEINLTDGIEISASTSNRGNSGDITLEGNSINLDDATIKALTTGEGNPGSIFISNGENNANQVKLTNSTISTEIKADGDRENAPPANITINSDNLSLDSSMITASTSANRDAGEIKINTPTLTIGENSEISASTLGSGDGGDIKITADSLVLENQGQINTLSQGKGDAGDINLDVNGLFTATDGNISANANQAGGGKIIINAQNIRLRGDSDIRTNVNSGAGDGGNITITADSIINFNDSDIFAFARDGRGGNISLNTPVFLGDGYQPGDSDSVNDPNILDGNGKVDINATGAVSGVILIPDTTFIQKGLVQLPESFIDPESLIANTCIVPNSRQKGTFIIKGAGGLPISPGKPYISPYPTGTVQPLPNTQPNIDDNQSWQKGDPIVEPQGIFKTAEGKLILSRQCP